LLTGACTRQGRLSRGLLAHATRQAALAGEASVNQNRGE